MSNLVKQTCRLCPTAGKQINFFPNPWKTVAAPASSFSTTCTCQQTNASYKPASENRAMIFSKKMLAKVSLKKLTGQPLQQQEHWKPWPNSVNPYTGEIGGPSGPEPTRYGDWERKGRVSDF